MRVRLTVSAVHGEPLDLVVSAPAGTRFDAIAPALLATAGAEGPLYAGGRLLDPAQVLGAAPLVEGAQLTLASPGSAAAGAEGAELRVVGGPDAGAVFPLALGETCLGRSERAGLRLADPDVSRLHAAITISPTGVAVRDLGSTNGTTVDGAPVGREAVPLGPHALLRVGESTLALAADDPQRAAVSADGAGRLSVNRPPRIRRSVPAAEITLPSEPVAPQPARFPVASLLVPLLVGGGLALWEPRFALFMLLSPLMLGLNAVSERVIGRRGRRRMAAEHGRQQAACAERIAEATAAEARIRRSEAPDLATLQDAALRPTPRLWERRPHDADFLTLRLGLADLPGRLSVRDAAGDRATHPRVPAVPVTVRLPEAGVLGISGPRDRVDGLARSLVAQLAGWQSPRDLQIVVLCAGRTGAWRWSRWLPHLASRTGGSGGLLVGADEEQLRIRVADLNARLDATAAAGQASARAARRDPATVVVLDGAHRMRALPGVARLLAEGPGAGIYPICIEEDPLELPVECEATAVLSGAVGTRLRLHGPGAPGAEVVADLAGQSWAERFARALAPLQDATPGGDAGLPGSVRLLDLLDLDPPRPEPIRRRWQHGGSPTALLGLAPDGPYELDLRTDGPHLLIAGTTGAGKSELLQTMISSLAVANRPDELAFVLIDYKGGAAFRECARLPHTVGMVTDLDGQSTERALASLNAEIKRRERLFRDADCADLAGYLSGPHRPPVPRLVIVIDEFATLSEELPDFVAGLVDLARRGRSLGIHLVLATQRPGGVVSAEIRANTTSRIALRVADQADSHDVIDAGDAATISKSTPGRAFCRTAAQALVPFQAARVGGRPVAREDVVSVRPYDWTATGNASADVAGEDDAGSPTDLALLVAAVGTAAEQARIAPAASPWLPPLPGTVTLEDLTAGPELLPIGLTDRPAEQSRGVLSLDLVYGDHLLVAGGPRSGRTAVLRAVAGSIARREVGEVHLYALDCAGGALLCVESLPHAGAVVSREDTARADRMISRLLEEVRRRQELLRGSGYASLAEQRAAGTEPLPWLVLLVDGWEGFTEAFEEIDHGRPVDALLQLLREGPAVGLRAVVTGQRAVLTGRLGALVQARLVLRMPDPADYALAGLAPRQVPHALPAGRGLVLAPHLAEAAAAQVALLTADPAGSAQVAALQRLGEEARRNSEGHPKPFRVRPLPDRISCGDLDPPSVCPLWTLIGAGGDELEALGVDLGEDGPGFLVAGPRRSGRSTALLTMAHWSAGHGTPVAVVAPRNSPLSDLAGHPEVLGIFGPQDALALGDALGACDERPALVVVDDAESLLDTPIEHVLLDLLRTPRRAGLVVAGSAEQLAASYRGLGAEARRSRAGLLLGPAGPLEGDLLGIRLGRRTGASGPGRGLLVRRGEAVAVQVAECSLTPCAGSASPSAG